MDTYFVTFAYRLPSPTMRVVQDQYQIPWCLNVNKNELWEKMSSVVLRNALISTFYLLKSDCLQMTIFLQ